MVAINIKRELEKRRGERTWTVLAEEIGCKGSHLSEVLQGKRPAGPKIRKYLSVVKKVVYVKTEQE
jgi:hypothetical protein